ncbi:Hypothetical predicted protein [Paramuricea clavata]|uniref:GPI ethanolamine phosphate transferase 2 C-terminal domain-containing protein n=2 Tax=Paramuricea clavata TaxID=317549 RepID=A0A6S7JV06_PARCT|nr:Hypothetical predicted protein [Paramuricea clavata]
MKRVNQIDITPTLAVLFGLSIPKNSIGIVIPDLLTRYSVKERLEALRMNAVQISNVYQSNTDNESAIDLDLAVRLHEEWLRDCDNKTRIDLDVRAEQISKLYYSGMQVMTEKLTTFMSSYDFYALYIGIWLLVQSLLGSVSLHVDLLPQDLSKFIGVHFPTLSITFLVIVCLTGCIHVHLCSTQGLGTSEVLCVPSMLSFLLSCIFIVSTAITLLGLMIILINMIAFGLPTWFHTSSVVSIEPVTFLVIGLLLHNISLLSTSFIEEEHQTWYFLTTTYHLMLLYKIHIKRKSTSYSNEEETSPNDSPLNATSSTGNLVTDKVKNRGIAKDHVGRRTDRNRKRTSVYMVILLLCARTLRSWNQTGIKWADQPDVEDWLVNPENKTVLSLLTIISFVGITLNIFYKIERNRCGLFEFIVFTAGEVGVYLYRAATGCVNLLWSPGTPQAGIHFAQFVHLCVLVLVLKSLFRLYYDRRKGYPMQGSPLEVLVTGYVLLITLLLRTHNIPLVALMLVQVHVHREVIWKRCDSNVEIILSAYYIGWFTYFALGNSNSLATVDIGAGYIGLGQNYWPAFVGLFTSLATFSGPLFWLMQAVMFIQNKHNSSNRSTSVFGGSQVFTVLLMIKSFNLTVCTILSWLNCYHLFVWSVFSPKLLYEGVVSLVLGAFILTVSTLMKI